MIDTVSCGFPVKRISWSHHSRFDTMKICRNWSPKERDENFLLNSFPFRDEFPENIHIT